MSDETVDRADGNQPHLGHLQHPQGGDHTRLRRRPQQHLRVGAWRLPLPGGLVLQEGGGGGRGGGDYQGEVHYKREEREMLKA